MDAVGDIAIGSGNLEVQRQGGDGAGAVAQEVVNVDRRLIVHGAPAGEDLEEEEFEYDLEEEEPARGVKKKWFAVVRYYSSCVAKSKIMFAELSNVSGDVSSRVLGDNRFMLEFTSESSLNYVLRGGPWTFKEDTLIVVRYDGLSRLFEVIIESIPIWIRIYDIPMRMMTIGFVNALGAKVGKV